MLSKNKINKLIVLNTNNNNKKKKKKKKMKICYYKKIKTIQ